MKVILKEKKEISTGTFEFTFSLDKPVEFKSGQWAILKLNELKYPDDRDGKRVLSITNSPNENTLLKFATRISDSGFKKTLNELPIGESAEIERIGGKFTLPQISCHIIMIAGGIGITPFMSMLRDMRDNKNSIPVTLIYSNRNRAASAYIEELEEMTKSLPNFKLVLLTDEETAKEKGKKYVDGDLIKEHIDDIHSCKYMIVGPPPMVKGVKEALEEIIDNKENIIIENFSGY